MDKKQGNVVMFPKWKQRLEDEGLQAIKEKKYEEALQRFEPLFEHDVASQDVITGKLVSLMELGRLEQAEDLCEYLMKHDTDNYYQYLHIYLTILFQTSRYAELVSLLEEIFEEENIPQQMRTQFWQLYEVSRKLAEDQDEKTGNKLVEDFEVSLDRDDVQAQWRNIVKLRRQDPHPFLDQFVDRLKQPKVHPIIKTGIVQWFQEYQVDRNILIHKFGVEELINPSKLKDLHSNYVMQQIELRLGDLEQKNPTMYDMLQKLLYRYLFVRYPLLPNEEEVQKIVAALKELGHEYLQLPISEDMNDEDVERYKQEIQLCEQHYALILGE
ncbi:tetratricopeptide repeat protein [Thalassobacillus hwangdonensis]|uniref:Tetratricopeptide repeat protein n=1 Tax=Thalassobacillus hwangdonensis TaxID=546108 RepID=A0ABW3KYI8_9BACI